MGLSYNSKHFDHTKPVWYFTSLVITIMKSLLYLAYFVITEFTFIFYIMPLSTFKIMVTIYVHILFTRLDEINKVQRYDIFIKSK